MPKRRRKIPARELRARLEAALWQPHGTTPAERNARLTAACAALTDLDPGPGVEGLLAVQMVATHEAALECLRRAMADEATPEMADRAMKHAERLLSIYARQTEVLGRHRVREGVIAEQRAKAANAKPGIRKMRHVFLTLGYQVGDGPVCATPEEARAAAINARQVPLEPPDADRTGGPNGGPPPRPAPLPDRANGWRP